MKKLLLSMAAFMAGSAGLFATPNYPYKFGHPGVEIKFEPLQAIKTQAELVAFLNFVEHARTNKFCVGEIVGVENGPQYRIAKVGEDKGSWHTSVCLKKILLPVSSELEILPGDKFNVGLLTDFKVKSVNYSQTLNAKDLVLVENTGLE